MATGMEWLLLLRCWPAFQLKKQQTTACPHGRGAATPEDAHEVKNLRQQRQVLKSQIHKALHGHGFND